MSGRFNDALSELVDGDLIMHYLNWNLIMHYLRMGNLITYYLNRWDLGVSDPAVECKTPEPGPRRLHLRAVPLVRTLH